MRTDPAAEQPLKSDTNGSGDMGDPSDEEAAELHELLQQMNDPAVRCTPRSHGGCESWAARALKSCAVLQLC